MKALCWQDTCAICGSDLHLFDGFVPGMRRMRPVPARQLVGLRAHPPQQGPRRRALRPRHGGGYAGGHAEYMRVPYADVAPVKIPDGLTDEQVLPGGPVRATRRADAGREAGGGHRLRAGAPVDGAGGRRHPGRLRGGKRDRAPRRAHARQAARTSRGRPRRCAASRGLSLRGRAWPEADAAPRAAQRPRRCPPSAPAARAPARAAVPRAPGSPR